MKEVDEGWYTCEAMTNQRTVTVDAYVKVQGDHYSSLIILTMFLSSVSVSDIDNFRMNNCSEYLLQQTRCLFYFIKNEYVFSGNFRLVYFLQFMHIAHCFFTNHLI